jgi:hypothetical protein
VLAIPRLAALAVVFVTALSIPTAGADPITVLWDANPAEEEILGYRVVVSNGSGVVGDYDVGNQTFFVFPDAVAGVQYFFSVTGYNIHGVGDAAEVFGFSDAPPVLANPGNQASLTGESVVLQLGGSDLYGDPLTYGATGLPPGLTLNQNTGLIDGAGVTAGTFAVTVSASDGLLTAEQPFTWYIDGAPPTVAITSPTNQPTYSTASISIALGGTAGDDTAIASVNWVNSRGGTGLATLTSATTWLIPAVTLKVGDNVITITAWDVANRAVTTAITVTLAGIGVPSVVIDNPTSAPTYLTSNATILLSGTASPNLTSMTWASDRGASGVVNHVTPPGANFSLWNRSNLPLQPGVNVITVTARDVNEAVGTAVLTVTLNRAPVVINPGSQSSLRGVAITVPVAASDLDGNPLTWTADGLPPGLAIDSFTGAITGTPTTIGTYLVSVTAFDGIASDAEAFTWTVNPVTVIPTVTAADKTYDGTTTATLTSCTLTGVLAGDLVDCTGIAEFTTATAGADKPVTASGLMLTGPDDGHYVLASTMAGTTAAITPRPVTPVVTAADKPYDGNTVATLTGCTVTGTVAGDVVGCTGAAAFDSPTIGIGKPVTVSGLTLTGAAAGNYVLSTTSATTTASITTPLDATVPTLALTAPTSTGTYATTSETLAVSGTASDNVGVTEVTWTTNRGATGVATGTTAWSITGITLGGGTTVITITAHDAANNTANATLTVTYLPPTAATLIAPTGTIATATPSFTWAAIDGATHYQLWVNDADEDERINVTYTAAAAGCSTVPGTCSVSPGVSLAAGAARWWILPSNSAGAALWGEGLAFTVPTPPDNIAPTVALTAPTTTATYTAISGTLAFSGTASDNVAVTQISWATNLGTSGVASGTSSWSIAAMPLATGTTVITITAHDGAGNSANATLTITYTPSPPGAVTLLAPSGVIATTTPSFSWTALDNATEYQLWVNDATTAAKINITYPAAAVGCGTGSGTCAVSPGITLAPGVARWWIRPSNAVGPGPWGPGIAITVPASPDTTPPTIAITAPAATGTTVAMLTLTGGHTVTNGTVALAGTASDNVGVAQVSWTTDRGATGVATGTTAWTIAAVPVPEGTTVITVTARDAANNTANGTLTITNNTPPGAATLVAPSGSIATTTPSFSWTAVSNASEYQLWVNDATTAARINTTFPAAAVGCGAGTGTCTVSPGVTLAPGVAVWWIRPANAAGAGPWGTALQFTVPAVPDTTVPTIAVTTPTATGTYTATSAALAVSGIAGDNVSVTQVSWSTSGGASGVAAGTTAWSIAAVPLAAGTTVITVTARDAANNTTSAMLTVTFNSLPPGAATLLAPTGTIATATPSFSWTALSNATHYQLWVNDPITAAKINITYPAAAVGCGAGTGTCTASPGVTLAPGVALWWVRPSNGAGPGSWGAALSFSIPAPPDTTMPTVAVTTPTSSGTYTAISGTLAVSGTASDNTGVTQVSWTTDRGGSGVATGTTAWSIAAVPLGAGTTVITVTARDAANNAASRSLTVTYNGLPPGAATLLAPTGTIATATPSFSWTAVSNATEYLLWVNDASTGAKIVTTYTAAAAGCGAGTGTCAVSPGVTLAPGVALWWIRPSNSAGAGPWGTAFSFTVPTH